MNDGASLRAIATADGSTSAAWRGGARHGEGFHDAGGAWRQARVRYAAGAEVRRRAFERVRELGTDPVVRVLDVGTGLGWNAAAALFAVRGTGARVEIVSLERDLDVLRFAAALPSASTGLPERCHRAVRGALRSALVSGGGPPLSLAVDGEALGALRLVLGDAAESLARLPRPDADGGPRSAFDAVFLDPFSPRVEPGLWRRAFCAEIAARMAPRALLATYSAATEVRVALAEAGLGVRRGPRVGKKAEGTLAGRGLVPPPEDADLARRIARRASPAS